MIFVDKLSVALTGAAALSGAGILGLAVGLLFAFIGIAIFAATRLSS